ncbi:MAG: ferredoxin [Pseudomonadota bacterium]
MTRRAPFPKPLLTLASLDSAQPGLTVMGAFHPGPGDGVAAGFQTLVLLGPSADFWSVLRQAPEFSGPDPVDTWSARIIPALARRLGGHAYLPFGGPPYAPFLRWARASGRAWASPLGMLVHDTHGLWVSYRGAVAIPERLPLPVPGQAPCATCAGRPCLSACPAGAWSRDETGAPSYDADGCRSYLDDAPRGGCLDRGCAARRACPVSVGAGRQDAQSAHHMAYFHIPARASKL